LFLFSFGNSSFCSNCVSVSVFVNMLLFVLIILFLKWFQFSIQRWRIDTNNSKWLSSISSTIDGNVLEERSWSTSCILVLILLISHTIISKMFDFLFFVFVFFSHFFSIFEI
jgi:hypothetical protein